MDEETARAIYACATALGPSFNQLAAAIDDVRDETLRRRFRRAVGEAMAQIIVEITRPLEHAYPHLAPGVSGSEARDPG